MTAFLGVYLAGCALLVGAGLVKVLRPHDTALAVTRLWPAVPVAGARWGVRLVAGLEAALGLSGIFYPSVVSGALVAASYGTFVVVVLYARARGGPLATCGCFGTPDTPPTVVHALLDALFAAAAAGFAGADANGALPHVLAHQYFHGAPLLAAAALCGWLAFLAMVRLPQLQAAQLQVARVRVEPI